MSYLARFAPHFHARDAEREPVISIESFGVIEGRLSPRAQRMVVEWVVRNRQALRDEWGLAQAGQPLQPIAPLESAGAMFSMVRITAVRLLGERRVEITLTNGETKPLDLAPLLRGPVFDGVRADDELFAQEAADAERGTLVWPTGADLCPDVLIRDRRPA